MKVSDKNKKKFLEILREGLKEELDMRRRIHREILSCERGKVRKTLSQEVETSKRRKPSYILRTLRGLSWVF